MVDSYRNVTSRVYSAIPSMCLQNPLACVPDWSDECDRSPYRPRKASATKMFTIENKTNNITVHPTVAGAKTVANADTSKMNLRCGRLPGPNSDFDSAFTVD